MRVISILFLSVLIVGCSTVRLVDTWENPHVIVYQPTKVLVVGMTSQKNVRFQYEKKVKEEYLSRGVDAVMSLTLFEESFNATKKTVAELKKLEDDLLGLNFDGVLFTKIDRIEERVSFSASYRNIENMYRSFSEDYYKHQPIFNEDYYPEEYRVYHTETSLYCICPTNDRKLMWKGYIDIVKPNSLEASVGDYTKLVLSTLEKNKLIPKK